jgi:PAS domain S-box-containing protein
MAADAATVLSAALQQIATLEAELQDAQDTLVAIRAGDADSLLVTGANGPQVYTLESADRPYRMLIERMREGALTLSEGGEVLYCNQYLADMLRAPLEQVLGHRFRQFVQLADHDLLDRLLGPAAHDGIASELVLTAADGGNVPVTLSAIELPGDPALPRLICGVVTDLTDQKRVEEQLRQSQKMEAVGQLTGGIAHDFNNLLTGILGALELLEARVAQGRTENLGRYTGVARSLANRAAAMMQRLLAFSRRQPLTPRPVDVNALAVSMEDLLRQTLGDQVALRFDLEPYVWLTLCDASQLESALLSLTVNARDAMPEGGRMEVSTHNTDMQTPDSAAAVPAAPGEFVQLCVSDDGVGMSPEVMARAFEPFFTTKAVGQGTGLGLSMIYGFAKQSGGHASIRSQDGGGTAVSLFLPRFMGEMEQPSPASTQAPSRTGTESGIVLVVEDEPAIRSFVVEVLQDMGLEAIVAHDGLAGLSTLQSDVRIDLMVTDVGLPGLNGWQLADRARTLRPALKVLFMTGYAENPAFGGQVLGAGMQMITKPFAIDVLAGRVREMIRR